jgi:hypothetical protein
MGILRDFDLSTYACNVYVETGTGVGQSMTKAIPHFNRYYTVDMDPKWTSSIIQKFPFVNAVTDLSIPALEKWLKFDLLPTDRVLFFLDAHFPDADFNGAPYDVHAPNAVPLKEELDLIYHYRKDCNDYIICDDARIYVEGPFQHGNYPKAHLGGGIGFIENLFPNKVAIDWSEEGYILIDNR